MKAKHWPRFSVYQRSIGSCPRRVQESSGPEVKLMVGDRGCASESTGSAEPVFVDVPSVNRYNLRYLLLLEDFLCRRTDG